MSEIAKAPKAFLSSARAHEVWQYVVNTSEPRPEKKTFPGYPVQEPGSLRTEADRLRVTAEIAAFHEALADAQEAWDRRTEKEATAMLASETSGETGKAFDRLVAQTGGDRDAARIVRDSKKVSLTMGVSKDVASLAMLFMKNGTSSKEALREARAALSTNTNNQENRSMSNGNSMPSPQEVSDLYQRLFPQPEKTGRPQRVQYLNDLDQYQKDLAEWSKENQLLIDVWEKGRARAVSRVMANRAVAPELVAALKRAYPSGMFVAWDPNSDEAKELSMGAPADVLTLSFEDHVNAVQRAERCARNRAYDIALTERQLAETGTVTRRVPAGGGDALHLTASSDEDLCALPFEAHVNSVVKRDGCSRNDAYDRVLAVRELQTMVGR